MEANLSYKDKTGSLEIGKQEISLRSLDLSDLDDFMVWMTDDRVADFCTWETCKSKEDALDHIKKKIVPHPWYRVICIENKPVGAIMFSPKEGEDRCRGEIGFHIGSKHWGKGIATLAVKMSLGIIFKTWPLIERVEGYVDFENKGSQRVLEKAGFQRDGIFRKLLIIKVKSIEISRFVGVISSSTGVN
ncbi:hypothetical protein MKW98_001154 [Papaver atlanticum]|uniref:N-acetyltransferase domain-containing protein n=1 Tax=Papaver atlanticum TaxID=357466 RepID=A0AAD4STX7_9MAGN|nr:hypothetical protein MKW98_001154 [Papaver atlanticum]